MSEMITKICPLKTIANMCLGDVGNLHDECLGDRCAWYGRYGQCAIKDIGDAVRLLAVRP